MLGGGEGKPDPPSLTTGHTTNITARPHLLFHTNIHNTHPTPHIYINSPWIKSLVARLFRQPIRPYLSNLLVDARVRGRVRIRPGHSLVFCRVCQSVVLRARAGELVGWLIGWFDVSVRYDECARSRHIYTLMRTKQKKNNTKRGTAASWWNTASACAASGGSPVCTCMRTQALPRLIDCMRWVVVVDMFFLYECLVGVSTDDQGQPKRACHHHPSFITPSPPKNKHK